MRTTKPRAEKISGPPGSVYSVSSVLIPNFKIGVDGGGTKTECILVDAAGVIAARHLAPGCNPSQTGPEQARAILQEALQTLCAKLPAGGGGPSKISATLLCMAGNRAFWRETAASLQGFGEVSTTDDSIPVLELATGGQPGLVLHAGTGSFVAARGLDGVAYYAGGLGWKLGDAGSGFDLGRRAIAAALLELQGWPPYGATRLSPIAEALCTHTGLADYTANSRFFYNDPAANASIAAFAPRVIDLATRDCGPAQQVLADSITELARLADQVIHRLFPSPAAKLPCGVSGRILNSIPAAFALRSLVSKLNWPVHLHFIDTPPIEGVRRMLAKL
jgi:N-acetylglucosamine kinase-like BadF-type ATPase